MPALTAEEFGALAVDIGERGILVPIVVDQHDRIIDGHHRRLVADELGIDCPVEIRHVADDDEARQLALTLNVARRHLSQAQRAELIRDELRNRPGDSDRAIARRCGTSPTTVGKYRAEVSRLDTAEAQELDARIDENLERARESMVVAAWVLHRPDLTHDDDHPEPVSWQVAGDLLEREMFAAASDALIGSLGAEDFHSFWHSCFGPLFDEVRAFDCRERGLHDCPRCTDERLAWRDENPSAAYKHRDGRCPCAEVGERDQ